MPSFDILAAPGLPADAAIAAARATPGAAFAAGPAERIALPTPCAPLPTTLATFLAPLAIDLRSCA